MITADTITDAQIRVLMEDAKRRGHKPTVRICRIALNDGVVHFREDTIRSARARCAIIINENENQ